MKNDIKQILVSEADIEKMTTRLGEQISKDYADKEPLFVGCLKGCLPFMSDLVKHVTIPCTLDYLRVSSYEGKTSTGQLVIKGQTPDVEGKNVIIIDDILDTGRTLDAVTKMFIEMGALSVEICVMLDKPEGRKVPVVPKYVGGLVPNEFVVGYGLDYNEKYRNLPYIGVLKEEVYSK